MRGKGDAATEFHALCEGLAALELRGQLTTGDSEQIWRDALTALVNGFSATAQHPAAKAGGRSKQRT
jgi:hypothetical protein